MAIDAGSRFILILLLMNSNHHGTFVLNLDDAVVEERISFIRRSCGMDRSNLITVSCIKEDGSLQTAQVALERCSFLLTSAMKVIQDTSSIYYREHEKRIRRKKAKLNSGLTSILNSASSPLSSEGWSIRYDFKLALVYELKHDYDSAIKYNILLIIDVILIHTIPCFH